MATLRREVPDRVPYDITAFSNGLGGFNREAARLFKERTGCDDPDKYFGVEKDIEWVSFKDTGLDLKERFLKFHNLSENEKFSLNEWGTALVDGSVPSFVHFVPPSAITNAKTIKEIEEYPLPDFTSDYRHKHLEEEVRKIREKRVASVAFMNKTIFEVAWQIRGFNELLTDFVSN